MPGGAGLVALTGILIVSPEAAGGIALDVVGECPAAAEVRRLLTELVSADEARGAVVSIQDRGARYRVAVYDTATTLDDPARDCGARARQGAVVVASELRSHPRVFGPPEWTIEKGVVFDVASTPAGAVWAGGAEIRGAYGSGPWSLVGAAGTRAPVTLAFENAWQAELLRFPLDVGASYTLYRWKLRPWFVVGPSATVTGILGVNVLESDRQWRFDLGGVAMAGATLPVWGRLGGAALVRPVAQLHGRRQGEQPMSAKQRVTVLALAVLALALAAASCRQDVPLGVAANVDAAGADAADAGAEDR